MSDKKSIKKQKHPWRICPIGEHWVTTHPRRKKIGSTKVTGHCRENPSRKDQIYSEELIKISEKYFSNIKPQPKNDHLDFPYKGNRYNEKIAGWTKYWNDILSPNEKLDPNLVKALIATESSFDINAKAFAGK